MAKVAREEWCKGREEWCKRPENRVGIPEGEEELKLQDGAH